MSVSSADRPEPGVRRRPPGRLSASAVAVSSDGAERAGADLDVHDERVEPGGELLREDRRGDQRDRVDGRRDVADRVEPPVGRREIGGLADDGAAGGAHGRAEAARRRAPCRSRECWRACRACRRCGRGRGPRSSARSRRTAATTGARIRLTLSPTPPVECLSRIGPPRSAPDQSSTVARARSWRA